MVWAKYFLLVALDPRSIDAQSPCESSLGPAATGYAPTPKPTGESP